MEKPTILDNIGRLIPLVACIGLIWCCLTLLETPGIYFGLMLVGIVIPLKYVRIRSAGVAILITAWIIFLMSGSAVLITQSWPKTKKSALMDKHYFCKENIHLLGHMINQYKQKNKSLPPLVSKDKEGNPLHSWRVHMLPTLEQQGIYKQLDLDRPWDDPENMAVFKKQLISSMFRCPNTTSTTGAEYANYVAYTGPDSAWDESSNADPNERILLIETDRPIRWYEPRDLSEKDLPEGATDPRLLSGSVHQVQEGLFHYRKNNGGHIVYLNGRLEFFVQPGKIQPRWKNIGLGAGILLSFILALVWPMKKSQNDGDLSETKAEEPTIELPADEEKS